MSSDLLPANKDKPPCVSLSRPCERVKKAGAPAHLSSVIIRLSAARNQTGADKPITAAISPAGDTSPGVMRAWRGGWKIYLRRPVSCCRPEESSRTHVHKKIIEFGSIGARERIDMHEVRYGIACDRISIRPWSCGR